MKFKSYISVLLTTLLLVSNMGLVLNVHYCKGNVSDVSLTYRQDESCTSHEMAAAKSCCAAKGESHKECCDNDIVKLKDSNASDNILVKSLQLDLNVFCAVNEWKPLQFFKTVHTTQKDVPSFYAEANAPPLFKLYCQYILYA